MDGWLYNASIIDGQMNGQTHKQHRDWYMTECWNVNQINGWMTSGRNFVPDRQPQITIGNVCDEHTVAPCLFYCQDVKVNNSPEHSKVYSLTRRMQTIFTGSHKSMKLAHPFCRLNTACIRLQLIVKKQKNKELVVLLEAVDNTRNTEHTNFVQFPSQWFRATRIKGQTEITL